MEIKKHLKKVKKKISGYFKVEQGLSKKEFIRLQKMPRFVPSSTILFNKTIKMGDALTFLSSYKEIFLTDIYKFNTESEDITIIDCGANIGLASIYLKKAFVKAKIVAFEPDPNIFQILQSNITSFGFDDVTCRNEAVSDRDATLNFWLEGGHSGMLIGEDEGRKSAKIKAIRLKSFLQEYENITFLKIDIEGEEVNVIPDIAEELKRVDYLFLEYHSSINQEQQLAKLLSTVSSAGMRYYIKEATDKRYPFVDEEIFLGMDMLINIFCYRSKPPSDRLAN